MTLKNLIRLLALSFLAYLAWTFVITIGLLILRGVPA